MGRKDVTGVQSRGWRGDDLERPWTPSSIVLIMAGVTLIGVGLYFILLRPPLLPEDVRYMALPTAQLDVLRPRLELWLTHVFRVMGGYILATGVLVSIGVGLGPRIGIQKGPL